MPIYILKQTVFKGRGWKRTKPCLVYSIFVYPKDALNHVEDADAVLYKCPNTILSDLRSHDDVMRAVSEAKASLNEYMVGHLIQQKLGRV